MIVLENISKSFDEGRSYAVRDVSVSVARGASLALVGLSGSGKTTCLRMVNRLTEPTSGRVLVDGRDVAGRDPVELRRSIGYVFQDVGLFPHWTIEQNVGAVLRLQGWTRARRRSRAEELLELVGLDPEQMGGRLPGALSGGQRQRVGVARALAAEPGVLLMDEPFGALDPLTRDELQGEVERIRARTGVTLVLVTHDLAEAVRLGDRVGVMHGGRLVQEGTPREVLDTPADDYVAALVAAPRRQAALVAGPAEPASGGPGRHGDRGRGGAIA
ncbi:MAG: ATP-binding cassette domain-containing protein [Planctomycetota bacterium]